MRGHTLVQQLYTLCLLLGRKWGNLPGHDEEQVHPRGGEVPTEKSPGYFVWFLRAPSLLPRELFFSSKQHFFFCCSIKEEAFLFLSLQSKTELGEKSNGNMEKTQLGEGRLMGGPGNGLRLKVNGRWNRGMPQAGSVDKGRVLFWIWIIPKASWWVQPPSLATEEISCCCIFPLMDKETSPGPS